MDNETPSDSDPTIPEISSAYSRAKALADGMLHPPQPRTLVGSEAQPRSPSSYTQFHSTQLSVVAEPADTPHEQLGLGLVHHPPQDIRLSTASKLFHEGYAA